MTEENEPAWITYDQAIAIHSRQLRRVGGAPGLRDEGMLRSALDRPVNKWRYEQVALPELAAAYAFGLVKNHAFVDGNKRIAFMTMMAFLRKNGVRFTPDQAQATKIILALAAGEVSDQGVARWIADYLPKVQRRLLLHERNVRDQRPVIGTERRARRNVHARETVGRQHIVGKE